VYDDTPYTFTGNSYWPNNENLTFLGLMSINRAMELSTNTVSVKVLADVGLEESYRYATEELGLTTLVDTMVKGESVYSDIDFAPLALGNLTTGVTVEAMAQAYGAFANDGVYREARTYTKVTNMEGDVILDNTQDKNQALSEKSNWYMTYMLRNVVTSGTGTYAKLDGIDVAGKTGTTSSDKDRWFCGYTPYYTAAVWCGYDQQEEIILTDSTTNPATYLWKSVMETVHEDLESATFTQPSSVIKVSYCQDSGLLATAACTCDPRGDRTVTGWLYADDVPVASCDVHSFYDICGETGNVANQYCYDAEDNTITQIGLLNLGRTFPVANITVTDQAYAFTDESSVPSGYYPAVSGTSYAYNFICTLHEEIIEEEEEEEETEEDALLLDLPEDEDEDIVTPDDQEDTEPEPTPEVDWDEFENTDDEITVVINGESIVLTPDLR
ncbi:MAG: penicillin-binding transpeptidase domain-containing protein, partial [Eubacteriales bacterium]